MGDPFAATEGGVSVYELIVLALLAQWPLHGYLIAKITNDALGPYARLSNGRLYPLLAKLEASGLIAVSEDAQPAAGERRSRAYAITEAGRLRFHELMMDTTTNLGDYHRIFWYKVPALYLLDVNERLYLLDHFITYCQTHIFHYVAESADIHRHPEHMRKAPPVYQESVLYVLEHTQRQWRLHLDDALRLRARIVAEAEQLNSPATLPPGASPTPSSAPSRDAAGADLIIGSPDNTGDHSS